MTTNGATNFLFDPALLPSTYKKLPKHITMRPLSRDENFAKYMDLLDQLAQPETSNGPRPSQAEAQAHFDDMKRGGVTYVVIAEDKGTGDVVATGTVLIEQKFIRNAAKAAHIEDIVVSSTQRGSGLGLMFVIDTLNHLARELGCYKTILDCAEKNVGFYEKCGFTRSGVEMKKYHRKG
ncbi:acyl-CoA N-acyltransferase [Saitoella complicata NRRL Y-17804]|uniref:acyl-CoA N-acyltransferase n=1 Tax=Saitoella complicata (strain BCRC 22490 / CBS 7301 / JCM 7358 / NBRC 10748 / NRRL Y-17804) TaxID=698492 RepID=UPI00086826E6|nr:acyl-CoA N-acyltransferase [Saitoella complicata NRRL Y-17804]ODQ51608.1 acyl-CoA N-acyltransferase [Saitoella complicata NRRL Y-17804]